MLRFINSNRMAAVGLTAALVLVAVTAFGRSGDRASSGGDVIHPDDQIVTTASRPGAGADPTDGQGDRPTDASPGRNRFSVPVDPTGARNDRTERGAQQSAIDFAGTVQQRLLYLDDTAGRELLTSWSAESVVLADLDADIEEVATLRSTLTSGGGAVWWSVTPVASHLDAFDTDRAQVSVWVIRVIGSDVDPLRGGNAVAPTVDFLTTTVDLVWTDSGGWSVWATSSSPGPVPMMAPNSTMSAPFEFMDALGDFTLTKEHA